MTRGVSRASVGLIALVFCGWILGCRSAVEEGPATEPTPAASGETDQQPKRGTRVVVRPLDDRSPSTGPSAVPVKSPTSSVARPQTLPFPKARVVIVNADAPAL